MENDLEQLVNHSSAATRETVLNDEARVFRAALAVVQTPGHLRDLVAIFFHHTLAVEFNPESSFEYTKLCQQLAAPKLSKNELAIGLAVVAPALQHVGWAVFCKQLQQIRIARKTEDAERDAYLAKIKERQDQITKTDRGSSEYSVLQLWVAASKELLIAEREYQYSRWHPSGYGTRCGEITEGTGEHAGKFTCTFYRGTSSD